MRFVPFSRSHGLIHASVLVALVLLCPVQVAADLPAETIIRRARAHLGGDAALDGIRSIRFSGSVLFEDGKKGDIEIIVRKPMQQRVSVILGEIREVTALSHYDGWRRIERVKNPSEWELTLLDAAQVRRLRANTWEQLYYFRGIETMGGRVEVLGEGEVDGVQCDKVAFVHGPRIRFIRHFARESGDLLLSETESGGQIREKGEIRVQGVRFPRELLNVEGGKTSTVLFTRVDVNEDFPDSMFEIPSLVPGRRE